MNGNSIYFQCHALQEKYWRVSVSHTSNKETQIKKKQCTYLEILDYIKYYIRNIWIKFPYDLFKTNSF